MERGLRSFQMYVQSNCRTVCIMVVNVVGVVGIVIVMKQLFQVYHYDYPVFLLVLHQFFTAFALWLMTQQGSLEHKGLDGKTILQLSLGEIGSIVFSNLSLLQNSVGMYQIYKLLNIPLMCVFEAVWLKSSFSTKIKLSLAVILGGIALATVSDVQYNSLGLIYGMLAVLATTAYQVQVKYVTKEKEVSGLQLAYNTVIPKGFILLALVPILEKNPRGIMSYDYSTLTVTLIVLTCILGIIALCTPPMIIQSTTPVTFQVVGHAKTCLVIASGYLFFAQPVIAKNVLGILLALAGMVWYSYLKMPPTKEPLPHVEDDAPEELVADDSPRRER